ncbi:glycosyltransferase [Agrobacterium tumefaciens]|uniref:Glycosyltransferase involved in cell wall biosynthesis n=1 Tax=Agrobacterium tumefaciens TaxID=358 RepID=A0AAW8LVL1_AGRTU|nr:glycosyltransferase [Agrobacterium tumefaciens]MDR6702998.1 glycosyltransferase involved in cell wall biosynthesis [Agrobacterium tumefaciens]
MTQQISVILPNFNGEKYLRRAISSFISQDHEAKQLVIVDAKSTDGSHAIIKEFTDRPDILWVQEPDRGISDAVNIGNKAASGDIKGFIGSDDVLLPGALSKVATYAELVDFDGVYFNKYLCFVQERQFIRRPPPVDTISVENLLKHGTITDLQTIFYRRRVFEKYQHNPDNKTCMDYELLLELARDGAFLAHVDDEIILEYMDGNISHGANQKQLDEAHAVALRFKGDYDGPMWSDGMTGRIPTTGQTSSSNSYKEAYEDCEARFAAAVEDFDAERDALKAEHERVKTEMAERIAFLEAKLLKYKKPWRLIFK